MAQTTIDELHLAVCSKNRCWRTNEISDANVSAKLGEHWHALLLDFHFSACAARKDQIGGLCDGVAVYPQDSNSTLRLLELKQTVADITAAMPQLRKGGEVVADALPNGLRGLTTVAELHVRRAPRTTLKLRRTLHVGRRAVPVSAYCDGRQV